MSFYLFEELTVACSMYVFMLISFLLNISVMCGLSNYFLISDLLYTHWTDFRGNLYLGLLFSLYIFLGSRKASYFVVNIILSSDIHVV